MEITATIIVKLNEPIDQPLMDWLPNAIQEQLEEGEEILSYTDTQPWEDDNDYTTPQTPPPQSRGRFFCPGTSRTLVHLFLTSARVPGQHGLRRGSKTTWKVV